MQTLKANEYDTNDWEDAREQINTIKMKSTDQRLISWHVFNGLLRG